MRYSFIVLTLLSLTACSTPSNDKDARVIAEKVANILDQMTLAEKVGQMTQVDLRMFDDINDIKTYHIGSVLSGGSGAPQNNTPKDWLDMVNGFQKIVMKQPLMVASVPPLCIHFRQVRAAQLHILKRVFLSFFCSSRPFFIIFHQI